MVGQTRKLSVRGKQVKPSWAWNHLIAESKVFGKHLTTTSRSIGAKRYHPRATTDFDGADDKMTAKTDVDGADDKWKTENADI